MEDEVVVQDRAHAGQVVGYQRAGELTVAVTVSAVNATLSVPSAYRLYLPEAWATDRARRRATGIPTPVGFQRKWEIARDTLTALLADDLPRAPVVADAGYGVVTAFREALTTRGLSYAVGVSSATTVWPPGTAPLPPTRGTGHGRPPTAYRRTGTHQPQSVQALALALPPAAWRIVRWREGTQGRMQSRFAARRIRAAHRDERSAAPRDLEWLLIAWPRGATTPTKYWLSTVPETVSLDDLVQLAKLRWRIERDYQEMKDELGFDHYAGRGWRGLHHHARPGGASARAHAPLLPVLRYRCAEKFMTQ